MTITKLKAKNQLTIPASIIKRLGLKHNELFAIDVEGNYIKLVPVTVEPRYTAQELEAVDRIIAKEKGKAKILKPGKEFSTYLKKLTKSSRVLLFCHLLNVRPRDLTLPPRKS